MKERKYFKKCHSHKPLKGKGSYNRKTKKLGEDCGS